LDFLQTDPKQVGCQYCPKKLNKHSCIKNLAFLSRFQVYIVCKKVCKKDVYKRPAPPSQHLADPISNISLSHLVKLITLCPNPQLDMINGDLQG
jgi:hypothetical protein